MSAQEVQRQTPAKAGREVQRQGEAMPEAFSDEAFCPRHTTGDKGAALLHAVLTRAHVQSGRRIVVDVDLAKFFDRVNHDILIDRL